MSLFSVSEKAYVKKSGVPDSGRGVYAKVDIKKNEVIERAPIIEIPEHDAANLNKSILVTYFFYFGKNKQRQAIALGFGSLYNHSHKPNAIYKIKQTENRIDFIALKDIKKDDEILINYSYGNQKDKSPLWFETKREKILIDG
jgi:SET domain-containing protein